MTMTDDWAPVGQQDDWTPVNPEPERQNIPEPFLRRVATGLWRTGKAAIQETGDLLGQGAVSIEKGLGELGGEADMSVGIVRHGQPAGLRIRPGPGDLMQGAGDLTTGVLGFGAAAAALEETTGIPKQYTETALNILTPLTHQVGGEVLNFYRQRKGIPQVIGGLPKAEDFKTAAAVLDSPAAEGNLKDLWQERGIHPAEAVHDAQADSVLKNDLTAPKTIEAFHGSPHSFDAFDVSKIGEGEGAQSYGHGLYFAENPKVAEGYAERLAAQKNADRKMPQEVLDALDGLGRLGYDSRGEAMRGIREEFNAGKDWKDNYDGHQPQDAAHAKVIDDYLGKERPVAKPNFYQVRIHADKDRMLDWDKPLSEQSEHVQRALAPLLKADERDPFARPGPEAKTTGAEIYHHLNRQPAVDWDPIADPFGRTHSLDPQSGSRALQDAGIKGIKYLDQGSRGAASEGTRNFVVFDHSDVEITHKNGEPVPTHLKLDPADEQALTETGGKPGSLGAAATDPPLDVPLSTEPPSPPGRLAAAVTNGLNSLFDIGRDAQMLVAPMARGTRDSMALAKDFANSMRRSRWEWGRIDRDIEQRFTPEQRKRMWDAADEESVMRQSGEASENMGLATLTPEERAAVEGLQTRAQSVWLRARDIGMVEGEGLPAYTPRMVINAAAATSGDAAIPLNGIGHNLLTTTAQMKRRRYLTAEGTEAAAKAKLGEGAEIARDIRTLPLATAKLEDAIAGRTLIDRIKDYGRRTGAETVVEGGAPVGGDLLSQPSHKWFTLDHPSFRTWRPKLEEADSPAYREAYEKRTGIKLENARIPLRDVNGDMVFEQVPLYVRGDFEGPLRAVLAQRNGALYSAAMSLKGKTMSMIMNSPLIHNAVEWGRALPAMPGKVATFKVYFEGNRAKNDLGQMREAIDGGLVPIGQRFFNQNVDDIMAQPNLAPGRSWTAQIAGFVPGLFDEAAGAATKRAIDKAGDFWHNTLLWDRVGDLQMGLYTNFRDDMVAKGVDRQTAARAAAHWANRYAGALPTEAMSANARKISNLLLFSRSFTMGNLGAMKDMLTGLPKDVMAQIERDAGFKVGAIAEAGEEAGPAQSVAQFTKTMARRKAMAIVALDMGLMYVGNSMLQNGMNVLVNDSSLEKEFHDYAERFSAKLDEMGEHPLQLIQPFNFLQSISATSQNEPGKGDRVLAGYAKDGTGIYARNPAGKIGEEFQGYLTGPLDMLRRKLGTIARPAWQILANDQGFGRKVYDPNADTPEKYLGNVGAIVGHLVKSQFPEGQIGGFADLVRGEGDAKVNALRAFGPMTGVTFSTGAPGGPATGELYHAREEHQFAVDQALPDIRRQILRGDTDRAIDRMNDLGIPPGLQRFYIRTTQDPASRLSGRTLRDFYQYATPEQRDRLERAPSAPEGAQAP